LRHARRGTGDATGVGLLRFARHGHGTRQIIGGGQNGHVFGLETQTDSGFVAELETIRGEILPLGLRGVFGLPGLDGDAHGRELGTVTLELLGECGLRRLIGQFAV